jgi:polyphosphate kinase 2 (PPK2 family)
MTENTQAPWGIIKEDSRSIYYINLIRWVFGGQRNTVHMN